MLPQKKKICSTPAIEDLKRCLEYTGQHSKLVESFISALRYRLLTAGASTNDILHQYVSTIKALRTIDPAGVFLEAVGEPISEYLRGRKDTIKCIVTMLTDGTGGNPNGTGNACDSLLEELNREEENQENGALEDDFNNDDKQAWIATAWYVTCDYGFRNINLHLVFHVIFSDWMNISSFWYCLFKFNATFPTQIYLSPCSYPF